MLQVRDAELFLSLLYSFLFFGFFLLLHFCSLRHLLHFLSCQHLFNQGDVLANQPGSIGVVVELLAGQQ